MTVKVIGNGSVIKTIYNVNYIDTPPDKKLWRLNMMFSDEPQLIPRQRQLLVEWQE